jgi:hypothetical protein
MNIRFLKNMGMNCTHQTEAAVSVITIRNSNVIEILNRLSAVAITESVLWMRLVVLKLS